MIDKGIITLVTPLESAWDTIHALRAENEKLRAALELAHDILHRNRDGSGTYVCDGKCAFSAALEAK